MVQDKQADFDEWEVIDEENEVEDVGNDENVETDLVLDSKPIPKPTTQNSNIPHYTVIYPTLYTTLYTTCNVMFSNSELLLLKFYCLVVPI